MNLIYIDIRTGADLWNPGTWIYITYKILDFPGFDGGWKFFLGAAITAALITRGMNPYITLVLWHFWPEQLQESVPD